MVVFDTICDSTETRQTEIKALACATDAVFIVGGRNSANTHRLAEISESMGTPTFHIETAEEIREVLLQKYNRIGISAGASTPNWIIERVVDTIQNARLGADARGWFVNLWLASVGTDVYAAIGAACLALAAQYLQGVSFSILQLLMAASYVFSVHTLNRFVDREVSGLRGTFREEAYAEARTALCRHGLSFHAPVPGACLPDRAFALALARPHLYRGGTLQHARLPKGLAPSAGCGTCRVQRTSSWQPPGPSSSPLSPTWIGR